MTDRMPFFRKQVECPICRNLTSQFVLRSKIFVPKKVDRDNYVIEYQWLDRHYHKCIPSFYAVWTCVTCGYSDFPEYWESNLKDPTIHFKKLQNAVLDKTADKEGVLYKLISVLELDALEINFTTAMTMHILAIYCNEVINPSAIDFEKMARIYLRTSWLFRDMEKIDYKDEPFAGYKNYWDFLIKIIKPLWQNVPLCEEVACLKAADYFSKVVYEEFTFEAAIRNIKIILLASELYLRFSAYRKVHNLLLSVIQLGYDLQIDIKKMISEKKKKNLLTESEEEALIKRMHKIEFQLTDVYDKFNEVREMWLESVGSSVLKVFEEHTDADRDELINELLNAGIPHEIVEFLKKRDERLKKKDDKKGILNFLRKKGRNSE